MRAVTTAIMAALVLAARGEAQDRYNAIWGISPGDVWAVGEAGGAAHFNGQGWVSMNTGATTELRAVWASGPRDVWAVGDEGTILHMTGSAWTWVRPLVRRHFIAVGGCAANDVWVVGQSEDMSQPPAMLHFDGSTWTLERAPFSFRPAGMTLSCPGGVTIAGTAYFDPTPDQRRGVGVILRRNGSAWVTQGWDGRAVTDQQIAGASWTSIASGGGATLLAGRNGQGQVVLLLSRAGARSTIPAPTVADVEPGDFSFTLAGDGTPLALFEKGFARYTGGRWAVVAGDMTSGQPSQADQTAYAQLAQQLQAQMARGQQPTQAQMEQLQRMSQTMGQASMNMVAAATKAQSLAFGRDAAVFAPTGASFFVASRNRSVMRVTGDSSDIVWSSACVIAQMASLEPCSNHAARQATPSPVTGAKPDAPPETAAPEQAAPAAPQLPSVPSISRPRIPRP